MALASGRNNGDSSDENLRNVSNDKKGRNYIYFGLGFAIIAILAMAYLQYLLIAP